MNMKPKPIGIHLGDLYSSVGTFEYTGVPEVIANDHGNLSTPSYVAFVGDQQVLIGEAAYDQANTNPKNTVFAVNQFIGRIFEDELVQEQIKNVPFSVVNVAGWPMIKAANRKYFPKDICSMILGKLKQTAESYLATKVTEAVITVPDYFKESQREAVKDAASTVGLTVLRFIFQSEAVTIAYGLDKLEEDERKNVLIFELNYEKILNASIVDCAKGHMLLVSKSAKILKNEKLTDVMVNRVLRDIELYSDKIEIDKSEIDKENLLVLCKIAKRAFLNNSSFNLLESTDLSPYKQYADIFFERRVPKQIKFSKIVRQTFLSTKQLICDLLEDANLITTDIVAVILVGHTTRVFKFDSFFIKNFIAPNVNIYESIPHDKVFAYGATVHAAQIINEYSTIDRLFRFDCIPLNIGIGNDGGIMIPVIERGTIIPAKKSKKFTISPSNCWIQIFEGQCLFAQGNNFLDAFLISQLHNSETIEVTVIFEIDIKGILIVSDNFNNKSIEIANVKQRRTRTEIELMWEYAELHRVRDDYVRKQSYSLHNNMENLKPEFALKFDGAFFDSANPEIELPLLESSITQTLNTKIEKLLQEIRHGAANQSNLPFEAMINSLTNARDILNRYSLTKNEFDSVFIKEQQVILEIFEQSVHRIRELRLDFLIGFYRIEVGDDDSIFSISEIIPDNVLLQMRSIQNLLILLVNVLRDKQTLIQGCSYYGVDIKPKASEYEDSKFEINSSSIITIQQTLETKIEQLLLVFNANSANSSQVTNVIYNLKNLKNVLLNTNSDSTFGDITFTNDESVVTKNEDVDVNKLEQTISEMQKIMVKLETKDIIDHSPASEERAPINIDNVLQQMSGIEQLVNTLVSVKQTNRKVRSKKIVQNKSLERKRLKGKRNVEKEQLSQPWIEIEQNFNNCQNVNENTNEMAGIIESFESNDKKENISLSIDQQIMVESIKQKHLNNAQMVNNNIENAKSYNEYNEESIVQNELKPDAQTKFDETNITQTIEIVQMLETNEHEIETNLRELQQKGTTDDCANQVEITSEIEKPAPVSELYNQKEFETNITQTIKADPIFDAIEHEIETNLIEQQQSDTTAECANQIETIPETKQLIPASELSNQNEFATNTTFKFVFNSALLAFVGYCLMKRVSQ